MSDIRKQFKFTELVLLALQGEIDQSQMNELNQILQTQPEKVSEYVELMEIYSELSLAGSIGISNNVSDSVNKFELDYLATMEREAPSVDIPKDEVGDNICEIDQPTKPSIKANRFFRIYNTVISLAAVLMVLFIIYANVFPPQLSVPVATVVDLYQVEWNSASEQLDNNEKILTNQAPYQLETGIVNLVYDDGVEVLIEGPAEFVVEKKGIDLTYGRLYSFVSNTGRGFTVDTPNNRFIDLGTEFGVFTDSNSSSELHVLKGKVQYYSGLPGTDKDSQTIRENNARRFDTLSGQIQIIPLEEELFVRQVSSEKGLIWRGQSKLNLADILGGGNGFGSKLDSVGIDPATGIMSSETTMQARTQKESMYSPVLDNPCIDGVFVPLGGENSQIVTSKGVIFNNFPQTDGRYWADITNRPITSLQNNLESTKLARVNDIEYGTSSHPAIMMHANTGLTFDLNAIRSKIPDIGINKFTSVCGLSETLEGTVIQSDASADMFVLIDGLLKEKIHVDFTGQSNAYIEVNIDDDDQFLTLVSCSNWNDADWTIFGDPVLEIVPDN